MLFNSYAFLFLFLPVVLIGYYLLGARGLFRGAIAWLVVASLLFYGWFKPIYLLLIGFSILFNFGMGWAIHQAQAKDRPSARILLWVGLLTALEAHVKSGWSEARRLCWQPRLGWAMVAGLLLTLGLLFIAPDNEFIYWQF